MVQLRPRKRGRPRKKPGGGETEAEAAGEDGEDPAVVLLPLGAPVEVRSDESGFDGSFYEATVTGYQRSGLGYVVAYATLSRSKDGGSPLQELAAAADVRPRPPPSPPRGFAAHEMVEAFHNDGWWAGVVCAVPTEAEADAGRRVYKVCFPTSRELLEFEETALRPNRVFRGERWIPAAEAERGTPLFRDGSQVEVSRSTKIFGKYWSPAIILKVIGATSFLVQYRDAREDGEQVTEIIDSQYIRPTRSIIHMDSKYRFIPSSHVEVFHEGSWWTGVVSEVMDNESTKKYVVKINSKEADIDDAECVDLLTVDHTQLRPKYNWVRGKWVRCLTEKPGNGPQLKPRKRPISAVLASSSDVTEPTASVPCIDSEEISDEPGSYLKDNGNDEDVVLKQVCPDFLVCNENDQMKHMPSSFPQKVVSCINFDQEFINDGVMFVPFQKPGNGPQLKPRKRPISAVLASSSDVTEPTASVPCIDSEEISDEPGSYLKDKGNDEDVVLKQVCPDFLACNENDQMKHMPSSFPQKVVNQQNTVLSFKSHLTVPSESSVTGFHSLKYDPKLCLSGQLELSSSRMITMPSVPQAGQLQASLFGAFGQLRPLPQGPIFRMQSHTIDFSRIVGSEKTFTDQGKQANYKGGLTGSKHNIKFGSFFGTDLASKRLFTGQGKQTNDKGRDLMTGSQPNIDSGSYSGTGRSRKRLKKSVSPQKPEQLGGGPKIMRKRKRMADKNVKEHSKLAAISEESTELNNNNGEDLSKNKDLGSLLPPQVNTVTCTDSRPLNNDTDSQGNSIFLRECGIADEIIPSGVPIGADKFHQEDYIGAAQHGATKVSVLIEKSMLSITSTLNNSDEAQVLPSDSSTQCGKEAANAEESAIIMEHDTSEEYCQQCSVMDDDANVHLLPSAESARDKDNNKAMVECVPTDDVSSMGGGVAPNLLPSSKNYEDGKEGMGKAIHQGNVLETKHANAHGLSSAISLPVFKKFAAPLEQRGVSQRDHDSAMVEFAGEASESMESSEITQLSSIGICNSSEAEQGDTWIDPKDSMNTPMSKYAPSRTQGSCLSLLQRSLDSPESIMTVHRTEPLATMNLPFTKTSPMWGQIEAMEVFRNMPQRPNFHKFQQHVPELREGMALGLMLSFANLAESIRRLSIHDGDALFEEKMKGLSLLEADGFDVRHLRSRLETLVHIRRSGPAVLQGAIKDLEKKISHRETDDRHLGTQIRVLNMTVRHLELQANLFRCMMQSAVSQKVNIASEIGRLKTEASTLERSYLSAEQSFSNAATAPW